MDAAFGEASKSEEVIGTLTKPTDLVRYELSYQKSDQANLAVFVEQYLFRSIRQTKTLEDMNEGRKKKASIYYPKAHLLCVHKMRQCCHQQQ